MSFSIVKSKESKRELWERISGVGALLNVVIRAESR